jgi:adenylate cyclase class 2
MMDEYAQDQELEVKFFVEDLNEIEKRLVSAKANLIQPRTHEYNQRFDTPNGDLARGQRILRLRRDTGTHLTYKGPTSNLGGVLARQEIEFEVSNFESAKKFVEALGYRAKFIYEKHRTTYEIDGLKVTLDEMPYGDFVEIEGPAASQIHDMAQDLGLDWNQSLPETYISIFRRMRELINLNFDDLTFENFEGVEVDMARFGILPADVEAAPEK